MNNYLKQFGILSLLVLLVSACSRAPIPASLGPTSSPVPNRSSAVPGAQPPRHTALPPTETSFVPTAALPAVEEMDTKPGQDQPNQMETNRMQIQIQDQILTATLAENSSAAALKAALSKGPITVNMRDYGGMEKVGSLGMELPRNDEQITTEAGDIILYQGNALVIYYAPNSWSFTRLGKINGLSGAELKELLGDGNVTIKLFPPQD